MEMTFRPFDDMSIGNGWHCEPELYARTEGSVATLARNAATDIEAYMGGRETDFYFVDKLTELIGRNVVSDLESHPSVSYDISIPLLRAMRVGSDKRLEGHIAVYFLEMRLLHSELSGFRSLPRARLEGIRDFCEELSRRYRAEEQGYVNYLATV